jgi:archaeosine synthase beta-subunit
MAGLIEKFVNTYSTVSSRYSVADRKMTTRWTLMLPGSGCEYWKKSGGCTMCGFKNSTEKYSHGRLYPSCVFKALYWLAEKSANKLLPDELAVYNGGSFWNDREIPRNFQNYLYRLVSANGTLQRLMFETRCEYINEQKIRIALEALGNKKLTVGIGLESQDDFVRNKLIRKGLSKKEFESKVGMLRRAGADVLAYVFLKPLGLTEEEALKEAISTIKYAVDVGVSRIDLSCAFIQAGTKMSESFFNGTYSPPSLWTILEIIKQTEDYGWPVNIGGFTDEPPPLAIPANCPNCSPQIYDSIEQYRITRILGKIPKCSCYQLWTKNF